MSYKTAQRPNQVTAVFQNAALSFEMAREATFAQLAEQLGILCEIHGGLPLSVDIRIAVDKAH